MIKKLKNKIINIMIQRDIKQGKFEIFRLEEDIGYRFNMITKDGKHLGYEITLYKAIIDYFAYDEEYLRVNKNIVKTYNSTNINNNNNNLIQGKDFWKGYYEFREQYEQEIKEWEKIILTTIISSIVPSIISLFTTIIQILIDK